MLTALAQIVVFHGDLETGLYLMAALAALVGVAAGLRVDGVAAIAAASKHEPQPALWPTLWPLLAAPLLTVVVGLVLAAPLIVFGEEDSSVLLLPLGTALVVVIGSLLGWLANGLVVWPFVHLVRWALRTGGRDPDARLVTLPALFFLTLVAAGIIGVIAVGDQDDGRSRTQSAAGLRQWILTWTVAGENPQQEVLLIVARVLFVLMMICGVAWIRADRVSSDRRRTTSE